MVPAYSRFTGRILRITPRSSLPGPSPLAAPSVGVTQPPSPKSQSPVTYEVQRGRSPPRRTSHLATHNSSSSTFFSLLFFSLTLTLARTLARQTRPDSLLRPST